MSVTLYKHAHCDLCDSGACPHAVGALERSIKSPEQFYEANQEEFSAMETWSLAMWKITMNFAKRFAEASNMVVAEPSQSTRRGE